MTSTDLILTPDQRLRLALLDRCLPVAGVQAVALAEGAYAFVAGPSGAAEPAAKINMAPEAATPEPQIGAEEPASGIHAGVVETAAKTALVATALREASSEAPRRPVQVDAVVAAIAAGHFTRATITRASGVSRGSIHQVLRAALDAGRVVEDRETYPITYRLPEAEAALEPEPIPVPEPKPEPKPQAPTETAPEKADLRICASQGFQAPDPDPEPDPERLKAEWLERNGGPSTKPNLGEHEEVITFLKSQGMFVARVPAGTRGRGQWRYGDSQIDTAKLYQIANRSRAVMGLPAIKMPKEPVNADAA